jgi:SsrA-binding protein
MFFKASSSRVSKLYSLNMPPASQKIFFSEDGWAKLEIGLGKGKKLHDKRDTIKARDNDRELRRFVK